MRLVIQDNYEKMSKWAANYIAAKINAHPVHMEGLSTSK